MQILMIHGGMTFKNRDDYVQYLETRPLSLEHYVSWSGQYLDDHFPDIQIVRPRMPLKDFACYDDWKIIFERYLELTDKELILIGNSLGSIFLAKYLSEQIVNKKIVSTILVCAPFDNTISGEDLVGGFELGNNLSLLQENTKKLHFLFSANDDVVPVTHAGKYREKLPSADIQVLEERNGHFKVEELPEIVTLIKEDLA